MRIRLLVLVAAALAAGGIAHADAARDAAAKEHYDAGTAAFNLGEWARAAEEYKQAYTAKPDAVLLYDIAQAYRLANDLQNAVFFYKSYLRNQPNASNRAEIDDRIRSLEQQIRDQRQVASKPPNSTVPMGTQPKEPEHAAAPLPAATVEKPAPSAPSAVSPPAAVRSPTAPPLELTQSSAPAHERTPVYKKWWLWTIVGGVVVVGVGVGLGLGLTANSAPSTHLGTTGVF